MSAADMSHGGSSRPDTMPTFPTKMGIAGSPDIFQASELMTALEFIRAYLDDLLCITKASLQDHLGKLRMVLTRF